MARDELLRRVGPGRLNGMGWPRGREELFDYPTPTAWPDRALRYHRELAEGQWALPDAWSS